MVERPFDLLNNSKGKTVLVGLKGNRMFRGTLLAFDVHMNLVLDDAEELSEGEVIRKMGKILLRGDTVVLVSPTE